MSVNSLYKCCIACNLSKLKNSSPSAHPGPFTQLKFSQKFLPQPIPPPTRVSCRAHAIGTCH